MRCTNCGKADFRVWDGPITVLGVEVAARGQHCPKCGETLISAAELTAAEKTAAEKICARGIRTGAEFKAIRKMANFRAAELASVLDVNENTVSRWERGEVAVPKLAAFALGELYKHPRSARENLDAFAEAI